MLKLAADENVKRPLVRALRRRLSGLDLRTVQEATLDGADDPRVLAWAAEEGRVLLSHDARTMPLHAYERLVAGEDFPGLIVIPARLSTGRALEDLLLLLRAESSEALRDRVLWLPL